MILPRKRVSNTEAGEADLRPRTTISIVERSWTQSPDCRRK
jgi:hypothetical protein